MEPAELMRAVRRRWPVVAATVVVALVAGWLTTRIVPAGPPVRNYEATSVLLSDQATSFGFGGAGTYNLRTIAALATVGEVPQRVATATGYQGDLTELTQIVRANGNPDTGILRITATSTDPEQATGLADAFATELVTFINERTGVTSTREADSVRERIARLRNEVRQLNAQIGSDPTGDELLIAERDAKIGSYTTLQQQLEAITLQTAAPGGLTIIQDAVPLPAASGGLIQVRSLPTRLLLALILGLLAAVGLVFILERLDTRIHTKESAEQHFDLPVLAEIPFVRRWKRRSTIAVATDPKSPAADSFRLLAAGIMRRPPTPPQVILVTGPGPGEGKSTAVANLAAAFAEVGKKVLVLSCDLHRPTIHSLFGVPNSRGLTDALRAESEGHAIINGQRWRTAMTNVRLIPSGFVPEKPGELLASPLMRQVIAEAREVADIVLIDTAPILAASDATHLFPLVDAVLVVGRAGRTTSVAAHRASELLLRLGAPVVGAALNGTTATSLSRGYYQYYSDGARRDRKRRGRSPTMVGLGDRES
jgi:capsular exopolysaccharide synthesis family protein